MTLERARQRLVGWLTDSAPVASQAPSEVVRRQLSVPALLALLCLGLVLSLLAIASISVVSAARAYVAGESTWSRSQKAAVLSLVRYARTEDPSAWQQYQQAIAVPLGDRRAREAMEAVDLDAAAARLGLLAGGNHADDVDDMIRLFRWFRALPQLDQAIAIWAQADQLVAELVPLADRLHLAVQRGDRSDQDRLLAELMALDSRFTPLEEAFSGTLGDASRWTRNALVFLLLAVTALLSTAGAFWLRRGSAVAQQSTRALEDTEALRRRQLLGSSDGFWEWDLVGRRWTCSPRFEALLGYPATSLAGPLDSFLNLFHPADRQDLAQVLAQPAEAGQALDLELRMRHAAGEWRWLRVRARFEQGPGPTQWVSGAITDVTDRRQAQQALQQAHDLLEQRVRDRTEALTTANQRLHELDRLKSEFLAMVSHELRTPLNGILGGAGLLLHQASPELVPDQRRLLNVIDASGRRLLDTVTLLLTVAELEAGRLSIHNAGLDLTLLLGEVISELQPKAHAKGVQLLCVAPARLMCLGDRDSTLLVLQQVLGNAIKFSSAGAAPVRLVAGSDAGQVWLACSDQGIGMEAHQVTRLFQPFQQADGSLGRPYEGVGLGLYLTKRLLGLMQGHIEVSSTLGLGTTVRLTWPIASS